MFKNRKEAAKILAEKLNRFRDEDVIVLAIPRGGISLGAVISDRLHCPLGVVFSKKIGHPSNKEFAIGAVSPNGHTLNIYHKKVPQEYIDKEVVRMKHLMAEEAALWHEYIFTGELEGKVVIIVDDGIATGSTLLACIHMVSAYGPDYVIVAVPVAPASIIPIIRKEVSEVICLKIVDNFCSIGEHYQDFSKVKDKEVLHLLRRSAIKFTQISK